MRLLLLAALLVYEALAGSHTFTTSNFCPYTVWVGALGASGQITPGNGGWALSPGQSFSVSVADGWSGRFWGRTGCSFDSTGKGTCQTGDCGGNLQCSPAGGQSAGGQPPASLAEFTLSGFGGQDFYDVSLVDGYNLPLQITPTAGTYQKKSNVSIYDCGVAGCLADLNSQCPALLQKKNTTGAVVACLSACEYFHTDPYCCAGLNNTSANCKPSRWPVNYSAVFKTACPTAYSYAYDDPTSTFTCHPISGQTTTSTSYDIAFCFTSAPSSSTRITPRALALMLTAALLPIVF